MKPWKEFFTYFCVGATATIIDWSIFWECTHQFNLHYETALFSAYLGAGIFHFFSNKFLTFQNHGKNVVNQYAVYMMVTLSSLLISMGMLALFINVLMLAKMPARMMTTALMLVPNYLLHKHVTFQKLSS